LPPEVRAAYSFRLMDDIRDDLEAALVGRYAGLREAGRGGMAIVFQADDVRHGRRVALKVLLPELSRSLSTDRFLHEIRIVAKLTHPHILPLHDSGEAAGLLFYIMPFVEGETLRDRLERERQLPLEDTLRLAREIAGALGHAHARGIVHRDVKPENILLADGHALVSDFGIAHVLGAAAGARLTETGFSVGTPAYMSPEQGGADPRLDGRSDIYSLACVVYEMLGGEPPFTGPTPQAVIARHQMDPVPRLRTIRRTVPAGVEQAIARALSKTPADRFSTAIQFIDALERGLSGAAPAVPGKRALALAAGLVVVVGAALGAVATWRDRASGPVVVSGVRPLTWEEGVEAAPSLSPDGRWIAYEQDGDIYLRGVGGSVPVNLTPGTPWFDGEPAFSPDGRRIAFSSRRDGGQTSGGIWLIEITGGQPSRLTQSGFAPAWSPDGTRLLYTTEYLRFTNRVRVSQLWMADVTTGATRMISEGDVARPAWSPSGRRIAYWRAMIPGRPVFHVDIWTMRADGSDARPVTDDVEHDYSPVWSADGRYIYFCSGREGSANVWRVAVDEETGRTKGGLEQVRVPSQAVLRISLAADDSVMVYESYEADANVRRIAFDPVAATARGDPVAITSGRANGRNSTSLPTDA